MDPDTDHGGPKTYGSRSATLVIRVVFISSSSKEKVAHKRTENFLVFEGLDVLFRGLMASAKLESPSCSWGGLREMVCIYKKFKIFHNCYLGFRVWIGTVQPPLILTT
jgi:hypothetical protein